MYSKVMLLLAIGVFAETRNKDAGGFQLSLARNIPDRFTMARQRILGGSEVVPHSLPYHAALYVYTENSKAFCGGSLISRKFVLTAAHCLWKADKVEVVLGAHNLDNPDKNEIRMVSSDLILHDEFSYTVANDIGLVKLPISVKLSKVIQPIALPSYKDISKTYLGKVATVSGWGRTENSGSISDILIKTEERVISNELCEYYYGSKVDKYHVCTEGSNLQGPCNGDSGGPLVINSIQIGIVSFGSPVGCMSFGFPSGYTRITEYLHWIEEHAEVKIRK